MAARNISIPLGAAFLVLWAVAIAEPCAEDGGACGVEDTSLLQLRQHEKDGLGKNERKGGKRQPRTGKTAIAFEGGGFLAVGDFWGLMVGLMAKKPHVKNHPRSIEEMLGRFDMVTSVSGTAWMALQMGYSTSTVDMLERMALDPQTAGHVFNQEWTAKMIFGHNKRSAGLTTTGLKAEAPLGLSTSQLCHLAFDLLRGLRAKLAAHRRTTTVIIDYLAASASKLLYSAELQSNSTNSTAHTLRLVAGVFELLLLAGAGTGDNYLSWWRGISWLMESTGGITPDMPLSSPPTKWADGKEFLELSTVVTGSKEAMYIEAGSTPTFYTSSGGEQYVPGVFSYIMGSGDAQAPQAFCLSGQNLTHHEGTSSKTSQQPLNEFFAENIDKVAGHLPISRVATVSSALSYVFVPRTNRNMTAALDACGIDVTMWAAAGGGDRGQRQRRPHPHDTFAHGEHLWRATKESTNTNLDTVSRNNLVALYDGGVYVDSTVILPAVAAGATHVQVWLDWYSGYDTALFDLFRSENASQNTKPYLCESPTREVVFEVLRGPGARVVLPKKETLYFNKIAFGSFPPCTTAEYPSFGIKAGLKVSLSGVAVSTSGVFIGGPMFIYGHLIQEITDALTDVSNAKIVEELQEFVVHGEDED